MKLGFNSISIDGVLYTWDAVTDSVVPVKNRQGTIASVKIPDKTPMVSVISLGSTEPMESTTTNVPTSQFFPSAGAQAAKVI